MLTDTALRAHIKSPPQKQTDIPDGSVRGLSARVTVKGQITWCLRMRVAGEGGVTNRGRKLGGRQYRLTLGQYPALSIKAARAKAAEYVRQAEGGTHPVRALEREAMRRDETIGWLIEKFLSSHKKKGYPKAKSSLNLHMLPKWEHRPIDSIDHRDAARLLIEVAKGSPDPESGELIPAPGAGCAIRKWGSRLFSWAKANGIASQNPFDDTENPVSPKPRQRFLDMDEARAVWNATFTLYSPWKEVAQLLLLTACRHSEIAHARWSWLRLSICPVFVRLRVFAHLCFIDPRR